jgi:DNA-binding MarR family transcriptional regulator
VTLAVQSYRLRAGRAGFNVGATEMMALSQLFMVGQSSPTELAGFLALTTASMTELLDRLERAGHVRRRPHATDRRRIVIELSHAARETMARMFAQASGATARAAAGLTDAEQRVIARFLDDVARGYRAVDPAPGVSPSPGSGTG